LLADGHLNVEISPSPCQTQASAARSRHCW
jgi:hypothetical protein